MEAQSRGSKAEGKGAYVLGREAPPVSKTECYGKIQCVVVCRNSSMSGTKGTATVSTRFGAENACRCEQAKDAVRGSAFGLDSGPRLRIDIGNIA